MARRSSPATVGQYAGHRPPRAPAEWQAATSITRPGSAIRRSSGPSSAATRTWARCGSGPRESGPDRRGRRGALVHGAVRPGLAAGLLHGAAGGPVAGAGHAADAGRLPGHRGGPADARRSPGGSCTRSGSASTAGLALGGKSAYYGTVDATPLFVILLGRAQPLGLARRTPSTRCCRTPTARWSGSGDYGDRDGDGFVEYQRLNDQGLVNQGWKDSWDGINFADGTAWPRPRSRCARSRATSTPRTSRARCDAPTTPATSHWPPSCGRTCGRPEGGVQRQFWLPDRGYFAIALDGDKRPGRRLRLQHGALPVDRHRRRGQGRRWWPSG